MNSGLTAASVWERRRTEKDFQYVVIGRQWHFTIPVISYTGSCMYKTFSISAIFLCLKSKQTNNWGCLQCWWSWWRETKRLFMPQGCEQGHPAPLAPPLASRVPSFSSLLCGLLPPGLCTFYLCDPALAFSLLQAYSSATRPLHSALCGILGQKVLVLCCDSVLVACWN